MKYPPLFYFFYFKILTKSLRCSLRGESKATPRFLLLIFGRAVKLPSNRRFSVFAVKFSEFFQSRLTPNSFVQPYQLLLVILLQCFPNRAYCIAQIAVAFFSVLGDDGSRLGSNQLLFNQAVYIFLDGVFAHADSVANRFVAWMALKGFSVFTSEQIRIDSNLTAAQSQTKYFIRHGEIIL